MAMRAPRLNQLNHFTSSFPNMSHTKLFQSGAYQATWMTWTLIDYATGGEQILASEIDHPPAGFLFGEITPAQNSLGVQLFPIVLAGKVVMRQLTGGAFVEIPPTVGLNAQVSGLIF